MSIARDRVVRDALHPSMEKAIAGEIERIDLDLGVLPGDDESDIAVRYHCFNLKLAVTWDDDRERLRSRDHASDRMHCELLDGPSNWRGQNLQLGFLFGLDHVLGKAGRLLFGLGQLIEQDAAIF